MTVTDSFSIFLTTFVFFVATSYETDFILFFSILNALINSTVLTNEETQEKLILPNESKSHKNKFQNRIEVTPLSVLPSYSDMVLEKV